ncbi:MAG: hypothetical protein C4289_02195 [Chloroflexota bacterium]
MLKQLHTRFMLFLFLADLALTLGALQLAQLARTYLPLGEDTRGVIFLNPGVFPALLRGLRLSPHAHPDGRAEGSGPRSGAGHPDLDQLPVRLQSSLVLARSRRLLLYLRSPALDEPALDRPTGDAFAHRKRLLCAPAADRRRRTGGHRPRPPSPAAGLDGYLDDDPAKLGRSFHGAPVLGTTADLPRVLQEHAVDDVIIALPARAYEKMAQLVLSMQALPVRVRVVPDLFGMVTVRAQVEDFFGYPLIGRSSHHRVRPRGQAHVRPGARLAGPGDHRADHAGGSTGHLD